MRGFFMKKLMRTLFKICFLILLSNQLCAEEIATSSIKVKAGFSNVKIEMKVNTPQTLKESRSIWIDSETKEIKQIMNKPVGKAPKWIPNVMKPVEIPAHPSQRDNIPANHIVARPFDEKIGGPPGSNTSKKEAAKDFLSRRPDITDFITSNTGITDPVKILEKWVYDVMQSTDKDYREGKKNLRRIRLNLITSSS
jgi:hypothetical protein